MEIIQTNIIMLGEQTSMELNLAGEVMEYMTISDGEMQMETILVGEIEAVIIMEGEVQVEDPSL
jgi:hypothetical protein